MSFTFSRAAFNIPWTVPRMQTTMASNVCTHRTALITGASGGIGAETAAGLLRVLPTLERMYLCNRDVEKGERVAYELRKNYPSVEIVNVPLDLSKLESVRSCAKEVHSSLNGHHIDVTICNAGVMACPLSYTAESVEHQFGVNHVGHTLLVLSLLQRLKRIVFVSSVAAGISRRKQSAPLIAEKLKDQFEESSYERWTMYGDSKLAMSMFASALAATGKDAVSLHPGVVLTELQRHVLPDALFSWITRNGTIQALLKRFAGLFGVMSPEQGAQLSIALASETTNVDTGAFYLYRNTLSPNFLTPLLYQPDECRKVLDDAVAFAEKYTMEKENGASVELSLQEVSA